MGNSPSILTGCRRGQKLKTRVEIIKSSRHQKIIGNFGESLICNWLSQSGFEVAIVDHTGVDIIAYNLGTQK